MLSSSTNEAPCLIGRGKFERVKKVSPRIACKPFYHHEKFLTIFTWLRGGETEGRKGGKVSLLPFRFLLLDPINERRNGKGRRKNNQNCFYSFSQKVCQNPPPWVGRRSCKIYVALLRPPLSSLPSSFPSTLLAFWHGTQESLQSLSLPRDKRELVALLFPERENSLARKKQACRTAAASFSPLSFLFLAKR